MPSGLTAGGGRKKGGRQLSSSPGRERPPPCVKCCQYSPQCVCVPHSHCFCCFCCCLTHIYTENLLCSYWCDCVSLMLSVSEILSAAGRFCSYPCFVSTVITCDVMRLIIDYTIQVVVFSWLIKTLMCNSFSPSDVTTHSNMWFLVVVKYKEFRVKQTSAERCSHCLVKRVEFLFFCFIWTLIDGVVMINDWLTDALIDWLIDWLTDVLISMCVIRCSQSIYSVFLLQPPGAPKSNRWNSAGLCSLPSLCLDVPHKTDRRLVLWLEWLNVL